jgi:hypothetical protein
MVPVDALAPHPRNVNQADCGQIIENIKANRFFGAVVAQKSTGLILCGKHRWIAARACGLELIPVIWADVSDEVGIKIMLSDNRLCRLGVDDPSALSELLQSLPTLNGTGFSMEDLQEIMSDLEHPFVPEPETEAPPAPRSVTCPECGHEFTA